MGFWLKDNKIIVKNSKLVNCDKCPCGDGWYYEVDGYGYREDPGTNTRYWWSLNHATLKIGDYLETVHLSGAGGIATFENVPGPTKKQSISGTVYVEVGGPCDEIFINMSVIGPNGEFVFTSPYWQKNANNNDVSRNFTISWSEEGEIGASYYLSWA